MAAKNSAALELELVVDMAGFTHDPLGHVLYSYPWGDGELADYDGPDEWQRKILRYIGDRLKAGTMTLAEAIDYVIRAAVTSGHGVGKSALVAWLVLWAMSTRENTRGVVTANTEKQLLTKTWPEIAKWHRMFIARHWFELTATAIFAKSPAHQKTWRIDIVPWSEHNTESFAGLHNQGNRIIIIFDEASAIADAIWEVTEGALTDANTEIIWVAFGNPTRNTGRFRECWRRFRHRWYTLEVDSREARMANKSLIQQWIDDYGLDSDFVKVRVRGMFPAQSAKQFISSEDVDAAFGRVLRAEQYDFAPKILTLDPAWEGDDELVIGLRQGLRFRILAVLPKNDNDIEVAGTLARFEDQEQADAVIIDLGYGTGILSAGKTWGRKWIGVWFSGESPDPGCLNLRAYMWKQGRDWLKQGGAIDKDQQLYDDLTGPETVPRMDGKLQLEPKEAMKKRGINSPNRADCLMLSFAVPVQKRQAHHAPPPGMEVRGGQVFAKKFDPLRR